jgi:transcriptional regulator with XRE-family HTH domain
MTESTIDVAGLVTVLEARVTADEISWRQAAGQIGVSPSLLSRLRNGQRPDLEAFARIVRWLRHDADEFLIDPRELADRPQPTLDSSISALLHSRRDLSDADREYLESILQAGVKHFRQTRSAG